MQLLGMESRAFDLRGALRRFGTVLRGLEEAGP